MCLLLTCYIFLDSFAHIFQGFQNLLYRNSPLCTENVNSKLPFFDKRIQEAICFIINTILQVYYTYEIDNFCTANNVFCTFKDLVAQKKTSIDYRFPYLRITSLPASPQSVVSITMYSLFLFAQISICCVVIQSL